MLIYLVLLLLTLLRYLLYRLLLFMQTNRGVLYKPRLSMRAKLVISYANGGAGSFRGKVCLKSRVHVFANGRYQLSQVLWSTSITLSIFIANDFGKSDCHLQFLELSPQIRYFFAHRYKVCTFHNESFFCKKRYLWCKVFDSRYASSGKVCTNVSEVMFATSIVICILY